MAIGQKAQQLFALSGDSLQAYAYSMEADFLCIHQNMLAGQGFPPHYNKLKIGDYLQIYDRILYVDCDIIIKPQTPNIFALVPVEAIAAVKESDVYDRSKEVALAQNQLGQLVNWQGDYFNAGVMVVSKEHRALFEIPETPFGGDFYEQTYLNWRCHALNYQIEYLPRQFNYFYDGKVSEIPPSAHIVHFAGWGFATPQTSDSDQHSSKYQQMQCFVASLGGQTKLRIGGENLSLGAGVIVKENQLMQLLIPYQTFGLIAYGPYLKIAAGLYKFTINYRIDGNLTIDQIPIFRLDVVSDQGNKLWYRSDVLGDYALQFNLELKDIEDLECRFFGTGFAVKIAYIDIDLIK